MKTYINKVLIYALLTTVAFVGCNPEDQDHLKVPAPVSGGSVWAVIPPENSFFDFTDLSTAKLVWNL